MKNIIFFFFILMMLIAYDAQAKKKELPEKIVDIVLQDYPHQSEFFWCRYKDTIPMNEHDGSVYEVFLYKTNGLAVNLFFRSNGDLIGKEEEILFDHLPDTIKNQVPHVNSRFLLKQTVYKEIIKDELDERKQKGYECTEWVFYFVEGDRINNKNISYKYEFTSEGEMLNYGKIKNHIWAKYAIFGVMAVMLRISFF